MAVYFKYFPIVTHTDEPIRNIMLRSRIVDYVRSNPKVFLPYTVEGDLRAEDVALYYYGSVDYTWLVYWSNNIIDPYYGWVMNDDNLKRYIYKKYFTLVKSNYVVVRDPTQQEVISFTQNTNLTENIVEFRRYDNENDAISAETYYLMPNYQVGEGVPNLTTRADGTSALQLGDLFYDEVNAVYYIWDTIGWTTTLTPHIPSIIHSEWYPVRYYEWEMEQNENRRHIELIDRRFVDQTISEMKRSLDV